MININKPLVLITNDDGIDSPGLLALVEAVEMLAQVVVVAPMEQQTNMGRGSLKGDQIGIIKEVKMNTPGGQVKAYAICGSPSQAVAHGILELCERLPDYCLSGINYGENLGLAFTCSGTLGATFEADSLGVPGIAFSRVIPFHEQRLDAFADLDWTEVKSYCRDIFEEVVIKGMAANTRILNVNFPEVLRPNMELRLTKQAYMNCGSYIHPGARELNKPHSLGWTLNNRLHEAPKDTDIYAVHIDGVISITPLTSIMSVEVSGADAQRKMV